VGSPGTIPRDGYREAVDRTPIQSIVRSRGRERAVLHRPRPGSTRGAAGTDVEREAAEEREAGRV
jgi:hypothetical protein